jgi:hypothetical protein
MPDPTKYDLDYRPHSYWGPQEVRTHFGARVKGELRRQAAVAAADAGCYDPIVAAESLSEECRTAAGAAHPWYMGGEYLPNLLSNEVEIARVTMKSTTMDVISVRARKTKRRIIYQIVNEYDGAYALTQKTSVKPLTLRRLIGLMDHAVDGGLVGSARSYNYKSGATAAEIYDFETASSAFYPKLSAWYDEANEEWLAEQLETAKTDNDA